MTQILPMFAASAILVAICNCVSTKVDFIEDEKRIASSSSNEDEDVEVKHTIVVSTKLKNNNRGLHATGDPEALFLSRGTKNTKHQDSGEVPIVKAYKSVDSTLIRTPDSRFRHQMTQKPSFNTNVRDELDFYPNTAFSSVWKPASFYNNINYWGQDDFNRARTNMRPDTRHINRRISDEGAREFYCRKCRDLSNDSSNGCVQQKTKSWFRESTTPKIKVDGKLVKLK